MEKPKHLHVIGICGVLSSALASAFHEAGWKVTGSDKGFYPPVSTHLTNLGISYYAGWHPEKMMADGTPDLVMIATATGSQNPETQYVKDHNITHASYTEILRDYFVRKNSIICAGTWGKTSSSALLSHIMIEASLDPSYMFGGISLSHKLSAKMTKSDWSVFEGDEYKSGPTDPTAKFFYYKPTHLLISSIAWDHADLYPTEADYVEVFRKLIRTIPAGNPIVSCVDNELLKTLLAEEGTPHTTYGKDASAIYRYENVVHTREGLSFEIVYKAKIYKVHSPMLGTFNAENIAGCFAMACEIGISPEKVIQAIGSFIGIKRRLEKRYEGKVTIIDAHAPTPDKAKSVLESLREIASKKVIAIFEPNIGGRQRDSSFKYDNAFNEADTLFIPRLTKLKIDMDAESNEKLPLEGQELADIIQKTHKQTHFIEDDSALVQAVQKNSSAGDIIVFLGSHGFRGMIEETISSHQQSQS